MIILIVNSDSSAWCQDALSKTLQAWVNSLFIEKSTSVKNRGFHGSLDEVEGFDSLLFTDSDYQSLNFYFYLSILQVKVDFFREPFLGQYGAC